MNNDNSTNNSLGIRLIVMSAVALGLIQTEIKELVVGSKDKAKKIKRVTKKAAELLSKKCQSN